MNELFIYHHLGLGDHLMCNGLVRELIKDEEKAVLFCKPHNKSSVQWMYRDLDNLELRYGFDNDVINFLEYNEVRSVKIGHKGDNFPGIQGSYQVPGELDVVQTFYRQGNVDYNKRWLSWYIERDLQREEELNKKFNLKDKYIFVHDDPGRNYNIKNENLRQDLQIIKPLRDVTNNIFDYCSLLENATEIHCMDSSFRILCEHINTSGKLFFHQYAKGSYGWGVPFSTKNWITYVG